MNEWLASLSLLAAAGGALFAEWRQPPPEPEGGFRQLSSPLEDAAGKPVTNRAGWERRRGALRREWEAFLGPFPARVKLRPEIMARESLPDHTRLRVRYQNEEGVPNDAYLLLPKDGRAKHPGMVVLHQTTNNTLREPVGLDGREPMHIALHLVRRGYVCVVPRNFLWGYGGTDKIGDAADRLLATPPWQTGMAKMLWDGSRALDYLLTRPEVDRDRVGCIGHSLGGKEAIYLGAFDDRIRATVSCEGGVGLDFSNWHDRWYLGPRIQEPGFALDHHQLIALIAPRPFLLIGGGSADGAKSWPYIAVNLPVYRLLGAEERIGLQLIPDGHDLPHEGPDREKLMAWLDHWLGTKER